MFVHRGNLEGNPDGGEIILKKREAWATTFKKREAKNDIRATGSTLAGKLSFERSIKG